MAWRQLTRREALVASAGAITALSALSTPPYARPVAPSIETLTEDFARGASVLPGRVTITAPDVAENGNTVPISFSVDSPMSRDDHVVSAVLIARHNPTPKIAEFSFGRLSGQATVSTRIRLSQTQVVTVLAKMNDGRVFKGEKRVEVLVGGCD